MSWQKRKAMEYKVIPEIKIDFDNLAPIALNALKLFRQIEKRYKIFGTMDIFIDYNWQKNAKYIVCKLYREESNNQGNFEAENSSCKIEISSRKIKK